ncbi:tetratricopeptide (TPR) repeat protein [Desulfosalsimonas propionicica]|uniref:Tetratricopeptide (TPR) repeat protein n=1 Tax=Desulfosalsimonas propionicica TaxID=332175 RepID=A0A7W0HJF5_9BACT|nr:tetratricopeptide repeat protein [Desulfosalsimonas propionicica]MBA2880144.1 tetratricopeptide (TPR) repeat protein [Desulfosalsimonas propionicica]
MSDTSASAHRSQTSSSAFLLSQSGVGEPLPAHGPATDQAAARTLEALTSLPDAAISPGRLMEAAAGRLANTNLFSVMVLRMDDFAAHPEPETLALDTAAAVRQTCRQHEGFWGVFDEDKLACFFPGMDEAGALELACGLQEQIKRQQARSLTIGIAAYPALDFDRAEILINAQKALEHAEFFGPGSTTAFDAVSLNISGDKYYQAGDIDGAVFEFKRALAMDPKNVNVYNSLGVCHGVRQELDAALECFVRAAELDPGEVMALYNAGYAHMCLDDHEKALKYFSGAEQIDPEVFEVAFQTGRVYLEANDLENALQYLERAVALNQKSGIAYRYLADCYLHLGRDTDATAAYKTALKLRPDDAEALSALGWLYDKQGRNADIALMFCRRAAEMAPDNGLFRYRLGRVYFQQNEPEKALAEFEAASACGYDASEDIARIGQIAEGPDTDRQARA